MAIGLDSHIYVRANQSLSNTWRNRVVAFAPIGVALLGIAVMGAVGLTRPSATVTADHPASIDSIITGSVPAD